MFTRKFMAKFSLYDSSEDCSSCSIPKSESFNRGLLLGDAQNLARHLMELPSNMLTPSIFAEKAKAELEPLGVKVNVYDSDWIKNQKMNAFWSVAKGSTEEPKMVEMIYEGKRSMDGRGPDQHGTVRRSLIKAQKLMLRILFVLLVKELRSILVVSVSNHPHQWAI